MREDDTQAFGPTAYECPIFNVFSHFVSQRLFKEIFFSALHLPLRISWILAYDVSAGQNFGTEKMGSFTLIQIYISHRYEIGSGTRWVLIKR